MTEITRIERLASGGDGVGRLADGRTVFVPRTAPGDRWELSDVRLHARFARAVPGRLVEPGPDRVAPRCGHYEADACGGCQWQHLRAPAQREARRRIVGDALRRLARIVIEDPALEPAGTEWGYRARVTLAVAPGGRRAGFHRWDRPDQVFDLRRCEIADERLNQIWDRLRTAAHRWPPALDRVRLQVGRDGACAVTFCGAVRPDADLARDLGSGTVTASLWWEPPDAEARPISDVHPAGPPGGVFEQVHPAMGDRVRAFAVEALGPVAGRLVWDLYAGIGETTVQLLARGARVHSVERDRAAVAAAERVGPAEGVRRCAGPVEEWLGRLDAPQGVVTNPPRIGMSAEAVRGIAEAGPSRIVYISCDPATLARDIARMAGAYRVAGVRAFDLFPQTAHVETVATLDRR